MTKGYSLFCSRCDKQNRTVTVWADIGYAFLCSQCKIIVSLDERELKKATTEQEVRALITTAAFRGR